MNSVRWNRSSLEQVQRLDGARHVDGEPLCHTEYHFVDVVRDGVQDSNAVACGKHLGQRCSPTCSVCGIVGETVHLLIGEQQQRLRLVTRAHGGEKAKRCLPFALDAIVESSR